MSVKLHRVNMTLEEIQDLADLVQYEHKIRGKFSRLKLELRTAEDEALEDNHERVRTS